MIKFIFIKNVGKYHRDREVVWADNVQDAWTILSHRVSDSQNWGVHT